MPLLGPKSTCPACSGYKDYRAMLCSACRMSLRHPRKGTGKGWVIDYNGYVSGFIDGRMQYQHRHVWEQRYGTIPEGCVVHHKNGRTLDNRIENLELMKSGEHHKIHTRKLMLDGQAKMLARRRWDASSL